MLNFYDLIKFHPYQGSYFNQLVLKSKKNSFEVDYWGVSNKNIQNKIVEYVNNKNLSKSICVYGDYYVKEFLNMLD